MTVVRKVERVVKMEKVEKVEKKENHPVGFISGAEPAEIKKFFPGWIPNKVLTEDKGFDFSWPTPFGWAGVQRKRFPDDFMASLYGEGDRLYKEMCQMQDSKFRLLIVEGEGIWGFDGKLLNHQGTGQFSLWQMFRLTCSIALVYGCLVIWSKDMQQTADYVKEYMAWTSKPTHEGLGGRRGPIEKIVEGRKVPINWLEFILLGFPMISKKKVAALLAHCPAPLQWNPDLILEDVPGIGADIASELRRIIPGGRIREKKTRKPGIRKKAVQSIEDIE